MLMQIWKVNAFLIQVKDLCNSKHCLYVNKDKNAAAVFPISIEHPTELEKET